MGKIDSNADFSENACFVGLKKRGSPPGYGSQKVKWRKRAKRWRAITSFQVRLLFPIDDCACDRNAVSQLEVQLPVLHCGL